jgi:hypothetical protein
MADIIHRIGIKASIQQVYQAIATVAGIAGWWTEKTSGNSEPGKTILVHFLSLDGIELGSMHLEVRTLEPDQQVHWLVTAGPEEWIGTDITFDLREEGEYTIVIFGHRNWKEPVEFMAHCSMKWGVFMLSLKAFVETGKGRPSPNDVKIDNWN